MMTLLPPESDRELKEAPLSFRPCAAKGGAAAGAACPSLRPRRKMGLSLLERLNLRFPAQFFIGKSRKASNSGGDAPPPPLLRAPAPLRRLRGRRKLRPFSRMLSLPRRRLRRFLSIFRLILIPKAFFLALSAMALPFPATAAAVAAAADNPSRAGKQQAVAPRALLSPAAPAVKADKSAPPLPQSAPAETAARQRQNQERGGRLKPAKPETALAAPAPPASASSSCVAEGALKGPVTPITLDIIRKTIDFAEEKGCHSILLTIDTPGGSLPATRQIVQEILNSPRPFLCLISPAGGQATSAGAIILQACHVSGALKGTNMGAATPVALGRQIPKESDMRKKMLNDTAAFVETLTALRGRNKDFGRAVVLEAKSVSAEEAKKLKAIDWMGETKANFLSFAEGRETELAAGEKTLVRVGPVRVFQKSFRYSVLNFFADPQLLYMIFLGSAALIYFELTHPGALLPGIVGGIGLILSLIGLNLLSVTWGALALIFLAIGLFAAEALVPSFGLLGIGGAAAFVLGSLYLFDPVQTGYSVSLSLILPTAIFFGLIVFGVSWLAFKTVKMKKRQSGFDFLAGFQGEVTEISKTGGPAVRRPGAGGLAAEGGSSTKPGGAGAARAGEEAAAPQQPPPAILPQKQAEEAGLSQQQAAGGEAQPPPAGTRGWVFLNGENWRFISSEAVEKGATVEVLSSKGMILKVRPAPQNEEEPWA